VSALWQAVVLHPSLVSMGMMSRTNDTGRSPAWLASTPLITTTARISARRIVLMMNPPISGTDEESDRTESYNGGVLCF
jgi:hypothetical protein